MLIPLLEQDKNASNPDATEDSTRIYDLMRITLGLSRLSTAVDGLIKLKGDDNIITRKIAVLTSLLEAPNAPDLNTSVVKNALGASLSRLNTEIRGKLAELDPTNFLVSPTTNPKLDLSENRPGIEPPPLH